MRSLWNFVFLSLAPGSGGYSVTVITDPRQGPFRIGTSVTLSCQVNPQPPGPVTYSWRTSVQNSGVSTANITSPNTTFTVYYYHQHLGWYFCYVYSNDSLVGVGNTLVETQGQCYFLVLSSVSYWCCYCRVYLHWTVTYPVFYSWWNGHSKSEHLWPLRVHQTPGLVSQWNRGCSQLHQWEVYCEHHGNRTEHYWCH